MCTESDLEKKVRRKGEREGEIDPCKGSPTPDCRGRAAAAGCGPTLPHAHWIGPEGRSTTIFLNFQQFFPQKLVVQWNEMEWNKMEWNNMEWSGMEWNGMEWNEIKRNTQLNLKTQL